MLMHIRGKNTHALAIVQLTVKANVVHRLRFEKLSSLDALAGLAEVPNHPSFAPNIYPAACPARS